MNLVDTTSHASLLDAESIPYNIHIIGCGAIGSNIALSLARLGFHKLHLWDMDTVAAHNVANQAYYNDQLDKPKVEALREVLDMVTGLAIPEQNVHNQAVTTRHRLEGIIFLAVDSMDTRKELFKKVIRMKPSVELMVEVRMNPWDGRVYTINPRDLAECRFWEENSAYSDADAIVPQSACGRNISVGPIARLIAEIAVIQFMRWCRKLKGKDTEIPLEKEIMFGANNWFVSTQ